MTVSWSAKAIGYKKSPPPFLSLVNSSSGLTNHSIKGINFASGGADILDITGQSMVRASLYSEPLACPC